MKVMEILAQRSMTDANAYLKAHSKEIDPVTRSQLKERFEKQEIQRWAQESAENIVFKPGSTIEEQNAAVRAIKDPKRGFNPDAAILH